MKKLRLIILTLILTVCFCVPALASRHPSGPPTIYLWITDDTATNYYVTPTSYPCTLRICVMNNRRDDGSRYWPQGGFISYQYAKDIKDRIDRNYFIYTIENAGVHGILTYKRTNSYDAGDPEYKYIHINQNQSVCAHTFGAWQGQSPVGSEVIL